MENLTKNGEVAKKFGRRYPWAEWFKSNYFVLKRGVDYQDRSYTMAQQVRNAAAPKRHNLLLSIYIDEENDAIEVTVVKRRGIDVTKKYTKRKAPRDR